MLYASKEAGTLSLEMYRETIRDRCNAGDGSACLAEASLLGDDASRKRQELRARSCELADPSGCEQAAAHLLVAGDVAGALGFAIRACAGGGECETLVEKFAKSRDFTSPTVGQALAQTACDAADMKGCATAYGLAFQNGDTEAARRGFGTLCAEAREPDACRSAAQIDFLAGRFDSAADLLERTCGGDEEINSCIELAGLLAARGSPRAAINTLRPWVETSWGPHPLELTTCLRKGRIPRALNEIFQQPIDGTKYVSPACGQPTPR
jgi:hypothetical protein